MKTNTMFEILVNEFFEADANEKPALICSMMEETMSAFYSGEIDNVTFNRQMAEISNLNHHYFMQCQGENDFYFDNEQQQNYPFGPFDLRNMNAYTLK